MELAFLGALHQLAHLLLAGLLMAGHGQVGDGPRIAIQRIVRQVGLDAPPLPATALRTGGLPADVADL